MVKKTKSKPRQKNRRSYHGSDASSPKNTPSKPQTPKQSLGRPSDSSQPESLAVTMTQEDATMHSMMVKFCGRRKAFTRFVMTSGIKAGVVRAIVALYEDSTKPDNALDYIANFLGKGLPSANQIKDNQTKIREMREKIIQLEEDNEKMRIRIEDLELQASRDLLKTETAGEYEEEEGEFSDRETEDKTDDFGFGSCLTSNLSFAFAW